MGVQFSSDTLDMIGQFEGAVRSRVPAESGQGAAYGPWVHGDSAACVDGRAQML